MANYEYIAQALDIKLATLLGLPSVVQNENTVVTFPNTGLALEVFLLPGDTDIATLFPNAPSHETGVFQINVVAPVNTGRGAALALAQGIRDHYKAGTILQRNGVNVRLKKATIGPGISDGSKYRIPVSVYYKTYS
jgi:hypothetical protein